MKLDAIDHFAIRVSDIARAVEWYQTSASCRVLQQTPSFALLEFANVKLALVLPSQEQVHLALERADAASYGELVLQDDGRRSCFVSDSSGNMVELLQLEDKPT